MHVTHDEEGEFDYQCVICSEWKPDTGFEPTGNSEICLECEERIQNV